MGENIHVDESPERDLTERLARLRGFTDVCNAVADTHSRGLLMLGPCGKTLVVHSHWRSRLGGRRALCLPCTG